MTSPYPWPDPPQHERLVVRLHPGAESEAFVLEWRGTSFSGIRPANQDERRQVAPDPDLFATPGLLDLQINGYWGRSFQDPDLGPEGVRDLCWSILLSGSTHFLPTIITHAPHTMAAAMAQIDAACRAYPDVAAMVAGIHQEGPWISPQDGPRGAHPLQHVALPSLAEFERLQQAAGGRIRLLTMAPEREGALELIGEISKRGIAVCLGHHQAGGKTIRRAVEAGARGVTHLGNGCHNTMPRHPNLLWEQAAEDRLYAGIIADGHHLPPATVKVFYRAKPRQKLFLVSDAVRMAGAPPGRYRFQGAIAEMSPKGRFGFYQSPTLIGAAAPLARCLANLARFVGEQQTPDDYLSHATRVPGTLIGRSVPGLGEPGTPATLVLWKWDRQLPALIPQRIVLQGRTIYDVQTRPVTVPFGRTLQVVPI